MVDSDSIPSFEVMGELEIIKKEKRMNKVAWRLRKRKRSMLLRYAFCSLQSFQCIAKLSAEAFWVTKKVTSQF
jgi:hypothetical protein